MKKIALLSAVVLAGCASSGPRLLTISEAAQMPTATLCWGVSNFQPVNAVVAKTELESRGVDCRDHAAAVQAIDQRRAAALGILLQQPAPQPYQVQPYQIQPRPTVNCTSQRIGNTVQTNCQ